MSFVINSQISHFKRQLQKLFPSKLIRCSVIINEDDHIKYYAQVLTPQSNSYEHEQSWVNFQEVIDRLARQAGITTVEQYIRINHHHYCEMCRQVYDYPFNVIELKGRTSFGVLNCCYDCEMNALMEFEDNENMLDEQMIHGGAA